MKRQISQLLKTVLVSSITIAIFYAIFTKIDFFSVVDVLAHSNPWYSVLAFLLTIPLPFISTKRWQAILKSMNYDISYKECFCIFMAALPVTLTTPANVGGIVKGFYLKDKIEINKTFGSVLTEKILDLLMLILFCLIGMIFYPVLEIIVIATIALICILLFFIILQFDVKLPIRKSWNDRFKNLLLSLKVLTKDVERFTVTLFYTLIYWFLSVIQTMVFFFALGIDVPFFFTMTRIAIAIFISMIPVTLGGMGTRDAAIIFLFSEYAKPVELLGVGILFSFYRYLLLILLGLPFMRKRINMGML